MKQLIEKYKERVKNINAFLNGYEGSLKTMTVTRTRERANCYETFITELEALQARDAGKMVNENGTKNC